MTTDDNPLDTDLLLSSLDHTLREVLRASTDEQLSVAVERSSRDDLRGYDQLPGRSLDKLVNRALTAVILRAVRSELNRRVEQILRD